MGENIQQALQYAATGNVDTALVALSLSIQQAGQWVLIPEALHRPLVQALAVIKRTRHEAQARQFVAFINGSQGQPIMHKYGFVLPTEPTRP
jgi:molybdate transport system substrate-binding protein